MRRTLPRSRAANSVLPGLSTHRSVLIRPRICNVDNLPL